MGGEVSLPLFEEAALPHVSKAGRGLRENKRSLRHGAAEARGRKHKPKHWPKVDGNAGAVGAGDSRQSPSPGSAAVFAPLPREVLRALLTECPSCRERGDASVRVGHGLFRAAVPMEAKPGGAAGSHRRGCAGPCWACGRCCRLGARDAGRSLPASEGAR